MCDNGEIKRRNWMENTIEAKNIVAETVVAPFPQIAIYMIVRISEVRPQIYKKEKKTRYAS